MAITNLERRIRFSVLSPEEYSTVENAYTHRLLEAASTDKEFCSLLESKMTNYVKPQAELKKEAEKLAKDSNPTIASFGKAVIQFLGSGYKTIGELVMAISAVLMVGGAVLSTCISLIIGIILFAVTVLPFAVICKALAAQDDALGKVLSDPQDANVKKYATLSKNIQSQKDGVKDIRELEKMVSVSEAVAEYINLPHEDATLENYCSIIRATNSRKLVADSEEARLIMEMQIYSNLSPEGRSRNIAPGAILESLDFVDEDGTDAFMSFTRTMEHNDLLCGESLLQGLTCIITEATDEKSILKFLNMYKQTAIYEFTHTAFSDFPLLEETGAVLGFLEKRCDGNVAMMESIHTTNQLLGEIIDEAYEQVKEEAEAGGAPVCVEPSTTETGFTPDPFNIGSLTPFSVAERKVQRSLADIVFAETDEELTEALVTLGRIAEVINECYIIDESSDGAFCITESDLGKKARSASDKVQKGFSKVATKDKAAGVKAAVKQTIDPMEKFIEKQYQILKEKDQNERREIIMKGGVLPKVLRWVKRGIGLAVGATIGQAIPAAAVVTGIVFIGYVATDKYLDGKERNKILRELEDEIQIVNEKIDDSRGDDNKQNKYELMRIRNQLTRTSDKIRFGLKYS